MQGPYQSTKIKAHIVNGFTAGDKGGNPAGVVLDADNFDEKDMLQIAGLMAGGYGRSMEEMEIDFEATPS